MDYIDWEAPENEAILIYLVEGHEREGNRVLGAHPCPGDHGVVVGRCGDCGAVR